MEEKLESRPSWCFEKAPCPWGEDEGIPSGDSEGADKEVFVCAEMGRKVEGVRQEGGDVWRRHGWGGGIESAASRLIYSPAFFSLHRYCHHVTKVLGGPMI